MCVLKISDAHSSQQAKKRVDRTNSFVFTKAIQAVELQHEGKKSRRTGFEPARGDPNGLHGPGAFKSIALTTRPSTLVYMVDGSRTIIYRCKM